jgi:DUF2934 family protein
MDCSTHLTPTEVAMRPEQETRAGSSTKRPSQTPMLAHDDIARRAYQIYEQRGAGHGHDVDDWCQAEQELAREKEQRPARPKLSKSAAA